MAYETLKDAIKQTIKQNGNQEITGDVLQATLTNIVDNIPTENDFIEDAIESSLSNYTYWNPSSKPYIDSNNENIVWDSITIYGIQSHRVLTSKKSVKIPISGFGNLIFILINIKTSSFISVSLQSWPNHAEDYITLAAIENGIIYDFLAANSRFIPYEYDLSSTGKALRLYPEAIHNADPVLYNSFNISSLIGTIERSNLIDIRISSTPIYERYDFIHIAGEAYTEKGNSKSAVSNLRLYISRTDKDSQDLQVKIPVNESSYKFDAIIDIPKSTYNTIDLENIGYIIYAFIHNVNGEYTTLKISSAYAASYPGESDQRLLEDNKNTLKYLTSDFIDIDRSLKIYGSSGKFLNSFFPIIEGHVDIFATVLNSQADEDGFLSKVITSIKGTGQNYKFLVGLLDQYSRFVPSREFDVYIPAGENSEVDVSSMYIPIFKGEQLAISVLSTSGLNADSSIKYRERPSVDDPYEDNLFYGALNETWHRLLYSNGGTINLTYKVKSVKSIFAFNEDVKSLKSSISSLQEELNTNKYIYDNNGYAYTLSVSDNRELVIKAVNYSNVLALGNSLTSHGYAPSIGYYGDDEWAMASTNKETTTWTKHLQDILQQKNPSASVVPLNIAAWETAPTTANLDDIFKEHIGKNYDLIIFRAGENGVAGDNYSSGFNKLAKFLMNSFPTAKIVITSMIWPNTAKDKVFKDFASQHNLQYINIGNIADKCILGQVLLGKDDVFHPIVHNGVANHCTDYCFFNLANIIGTNLGYKAISGSHNVQVITNNTEYSINQLNQVKDGYVTILTYGSSAPKLTANIDSINFEYIDLSDVDWINTPSKKPSFASVFKMPDSDVIINII